MKRSYEDRFRFFLPRRTYTLIRVDGRAFHTWTRGLEKPYDRFLMECMDATAIALCKELAGARFGYVQSDEISVLMTDFADEGSQSWFDGNLQKTVSVAASVATMAFNSAVSELREALQRNGVTVAEQQIPIAKKLPNAMFDARAFSIPDYIEVENYFVWRQQDAARNSVSMLAQSYASSKQLHGKNNSEQQEIIHKAGDNWAKHPMRFKHGAAIRRVVTVDAEIIDRRGRKVGPVTRSAWEMDKNTPSFTKDKDYLRNMIPRHWEGDETTKKASA